MEAGTQAMRLGHRESGPDSGHRVALPEVETGVQSRPQKPIAELFGLVSMPPHTERREV